MKYVFVHFISDQQIEVYKERTDVTYAEKDAGKSIKKFMVYIR